MPSPSSNMISNNYCPNCESFDLIKVHRSFIQKRILRSANNLQCQSCDKVISASQLIKNTPKDVPMFIEAGTQRKIIAQKPATITQKSSTPETYEHPQIKRKGPSGLVYLTLAISALAGLGYLSFERLTKSDNIIQNTVLKDVPALQEQEPSLALSSQKPSKSENAPNHLTGMAAPTISTPADINSELSDMPENYSVKIKTIQSKSQAPTALEASVTPEQIPQLLTTVELQTLPQPSIEVPAVEAIVELTSNKRITPDSQPANTVNKLNKVKPQSNALLEKAAVELIKQDLDTLFQ